MTERRTYTCDFNPQLKSHPAQYRLHSDSHDHEELGLVATDTCEKHLGHLVQVAIHKLPPEARLVVTRLAGAEPPEEGNLYCCLTCTKPYQSLTGLRSHLFKEHDKQYSITELRKQVHA